MVAADGWWRLANWTRDTRAIAFSSCVRIAPLHSGWGSARGGVGLEGPADGRAAGRALVCSCACVCDARVHLLASRLTRRHGVPVARNHHASSRLAPDGGAIARVPRPASAFRLNSLTATAKAMAPSPPRLQPRPLLPPRLLPRRRPPPPLLPRPRLSHSIRNPTQRTSSSCRGTWGGGVWVGYYVRCSSRDASGGWA